MLTAPMRLADQWEQLQRDLPEGWRAVRLAVLPESTAELPQVAAILGPANAGRRGEVLVITVQRGGGTSGPEAIRRLFRRLDQRRLWCGLELIAVEEAREAPERVDVPVRSPVATWDAAVSALPPDWSDLLCSLELDSSDYLPRAALLCSPLNPTAERERTAFVFRVARRSGYGASPTMARRCLERCEQEGITGRTGVLRVLSDVDDVATQGPVWYVGGRVL